MDRESQKRWDRTNMVTISCRITKKKADELKEACTTLCTNRNAVLLKAINMAIAEAKEKSGK